MPNSPSTILSNFHKIKAELDDKTDLMVVTKNQPVENIIPILEAGHRFFGENRVQEALQKWIILKEQYANIRLHLIGPLQRNKVKDALVVFDGIETIDRASLIDAIVNHCLKDEDDDFILTKQFLIQVNTGNEPQKSGVSSSDARQLLNHCYGKSLPVEGVMCIPPINEDPELHFRALKDLATELNLAVTSMGMSSDYPLAAALGASWVRVGSAIFN